MHNIPVCGLSIRLESAIPLMRRAVDSLPDHDKVAYAFPDDGAYKRFHRYFPEELTIICAKVREGDGRIVTVKDGEWCSDCTMNVCWDILTVCSTCFCCSVFCVCVPCLYRHTSVHAGRQMDKYLTASTLIIKAAEPYWITFALFFCLFFLSQRYANL